MSKEAAQRIWKKAYNYFLQGEYLQKHPKNKTETPLVVVCKKGEQTTLVFEFHDSLQTSHKGIWTTFAKINENYLLPWIYKDVWKLLDTLKHMT